LLAHYNKLGVLKMIKTPISSSININLKNQIAIVTGAAGGIGEAVSLVLTREGATVIGIDIVKPVKLMEKIKGSAQKCDLTSKKEIESLVNNIMVNYGKIDILVHCAGICFTTEFEEITEEEWDKIFDINVKGTFLITQAVFEKMKTKNYGKIVLIGSVAGKTGAISSGLHYSASKGAIHAYTHALARYCAPFGIYVNCVAPGPCETNMTKNFRPQSMVPERFPLFRPGRPEDIAEAVLFLASQSSNWMTGIVMDVNGGIYMS
jgi:3-oxoacyl-[acyl-carrier protein] reductase